MINNMKHFAHLLLLFSCVAQTTVAANKVIDISGNNTSSTYVSYSTTLPNSTGPSDALERMD